MSIREILVATDFSENADVAVRAAHEHAQRFGARLHIIHARAPGWFYGMPPKAGSRDRSRP